MADEKNKAGDSGENKNGAAGAKGENKTEAKSKLKASTTPEEGTEVKMARQDTNGGRTDNYMWVEGTGESKHLEKGKKYEVAKVHGEKLISKGAAKQSTPPSKPVKKADTKKSEDDDE